MENRASLRDGADYRAWLGELKGRLRSLQLKAALAVNATLLEFYWALGADIVEKQQTATWGDGFLQQLSQDLMAEFPDLKGFSYRNLRAIRQWYVFYSGENGNWQQAVAKIEQTHWSKLTQIPWSHNLVIVSKCQSREEALYALSDIHKPIGISEYQLTQSLPAEMRSSLPSIEEIEAELMGGGDR
jgi:hypothetical protein